MMGFGVGDGLAGIWIMGLFGLLISVGGHHSPGMGRSGCDPGQSVRIATAVD